MNYYVKNSGSDAAAGTSGGTAWKTIAKVNAASLSAGDIVNFNGGDVWRTHTDAALALQAGVTYQSYGTGQATISGGVVVSGTWTNTTGRVWRIAWTASNGRPRKLYVSGRPCRRVRTLTGLPSGSTATSGGYDLTGSGTPSLLDSEINPADIEFNRVSPTGGEWQHHRVQVASVASGIVTMHATQYPLLKSMATDKGFSRLPDYIENLYSTFLANQTPGTFYQDRANNYLFVVPPPGISDPNTVEVIAPVDETVASGSSKSDVVIQNILIVHTANLQPFDAYGWTEVQANVTITGDYPSTGFATWRVPPAAILLVDCDTVTIERNHFVGLGGQAWHIHGAGADSCEVAGNVWHDVSCNGGMIGLPDNTESITADAPSAINVHSNISYDCANEFYGGLGGVVNFFSAALHVHHNLFHDCPYDAISTGWGWGSIPTNANSGNIIEKNIIHHVKKRTRDGVQIRDGGAIYLNGQQVNSLVRNNVMHHIGTYKAGLRQPAIYADNGSSGHTWTDNVLYEIASTAQLYCNDNGTVPTCAGTVSDVTLTILQTGGDGTFTPTGSNDNIGVAAAAALAAAEDAGIEEEYWDILQYDSEDGDLRRTWFSVADDLAGANNSDVASWPDRYSQDFKNPIGATRPLLKTNFMNGHQAVYFEASDVLQTFYPTSFSPHGELAVALKLGNTSGGTEYVYDGSTADGWGIIPGYTSKRGMFAGNDPADFKVDGNATTSAEVWITANNEDGTWEFWLNGSTTSITNNSGSTTIAPSTTAFFFGQGGLMAVAEAQRFAVVLMPSERAMMENRLRLKYLGTSDDSAPSAPSGLAVSDTTTSTITWTWDRLYGASGYLVSADGGTTLTDVGGLLTYTATGIAASTSKTLTVYAYTVFENRSVASSGVQGTTDAAASGMPGVPGVAIAMSSYASIYSRARRRH